MADPADGPARHRGAPAARPCSARRSSAEVFLTDVRVPVANRVGAENDGWRVTNVTLKYERGTAFVSELVDSIRLVRGPRAARARSRRTGASSGRCAAEFDALWALTKRNVSQSARGTVGPGRDGDEARVLRGAAAVRRAVPARARPRRAARRRQRARRGAAAHARAHDRGRRVADPAQHHRRAGARPARGNRADMDLDLSDDQVALRDGIASLLEGRVPDATACAPASTARCSTSSRTPACSRCAPTASRGPTASSCSSSSGGTACPGRSSRRCSLGDGRIAGVVDRRAQPIVGRAPRRARRRSSCVDGRDRASSTRDASTAEPSPWPLDPLHAGRARRARCPPATPIDADVGRAAAPRARCSPPRSSSGSPTGCTELAVAYAKERVQFDRPIGSFQAIKHLCADMLVRTEVARAAVYARGRAPRRARRRPASTAASHGAKVLAGEAAIANGKTATQVFGGMGFTWEVDVHLYLKRAWVLDTHFGSRRRATPSSCCASRRPPGSGREPDATVSVHDAAADHRARGARAAPRVRSRRSVPRLPSDGGERAVHRARDGRGVDPARAHARASSASAHGDRVATLLENRAEQVVSFFAALKLGAIQVPINTAYKGEFLRHQLADSGAKVFVVQGDFASRAVEVVGAETTPDARRTASSSIRPTRSSTPCPTISWARRARGAAATTPIDDVAGAARRSRVLHLHRGHDRPVEGLHAPAQLHREPRRPDRARVAAHAPTTSCSRRCRCSTSTRSRCASSARCSSAGSAAIERRFSVSNFWPEIKRTGATMVSMLGSLAILIANADDHPDQAGSPAAAVRGGADAARHRPHRGSERFGCKTFSARLRPHRGVAHLDARRRASRTSPARRASRTSHEFDVRIVDDDDDEVAVGEVGEIVCRPNGPEPDVRGLLEPARRDGRGDAQPLVPHRRPRPARRRRLPLLRRPQEGLPAPPGREHLELRDGEDAVRPRGDRATSRCTRCRATLGEDDVKVTVGARRTARSVTEEELCRWVRRAGAVLRDPALHRVPRRPAPQPGRPGAQVPAPRRRRHRRTTWDREAAGVTFERR